MKISNQCSVGIGVPRKAQYLWNLQASHVALVVKNPPANAGDKRQRFNPWVGKIPWRRAWQPTPVFLPEESMDRGAWWAIVHRVAKSWSNLACMHLESTAKFRGRHTP